MVRRETREIAALVERLGRQLDADAHASGLRPVQWEVLRYLASANRFSRSSAALTAYLGSTKGTVSQTLMALVRKGLVLNQADPNDRRRNKLSLTAKGTRLLKDDPLSDTVEAIGLLPSAERSALADGLHHLLSARLEARGRRPFGQCRDCSHFRRTHAEGGPHYCALLNEKLSAEESTAICHEQKAR